MRLLAVVLVALPAAVFADTLTVTADGTTTGPIRVGNDCSTRSIIFSWPQSPSLGSGATYQVFPARNVSQCSSNQPTFENGSFTTTNTSYPMPAGTLAIVGGSDGGVGGTGCGAISASSASPVTTVFCVQTQGTGGGLVNSQPEFGHFDISFANEAPTAPTSLTANPGDRHIKIYWAQGNTAEQISSYEVHVVKAGNATGTPAAKVSNTTSADVSHTDQGEALINDTQDYAISVDAIDAYGNVSALSSSITARPTYVADFYNHYRDDGGSASGGGGCATGTDAAWIAALVLGAALIARRKKSGAALIIVAGLAAGGARAQGTTGYQRPSRHVLVGLKFDRYSPGVDNEPGLTGTPYHDVFGSRIPWRGQLEVDWEIAHPFGTLMLGGTVGYWQNIGKGLLRDGTRSNDTALLDVIPFGVIATYRFDWVADNYRWLPFIPYAQAGLMRALWASFSGTGDVSRRDTGGRGSGWTYGYTTALGVAVNLDAIDPALALEAYNSVGIQRTSIFAEYGWTRLDNFGRTGALRLSDHGWRFGLAVEF